MLGPKAFIFDLDGVITDTAEFHYLAWKQLAEELNITIDREFNEQLKGIGRMESLERILAFHPNHEKMPYEEKEQLAQKKNEHYKQLIQSVNPEMVLPGILELLQACKNNQMELALASASKNAPAILQLLELTDYFPYIVDPSTLEKGKPDPEIFMKAADYFGISYEACVGIEDAVAGIESINKAGMFSVGVGDPDVLSKADYVVKETSLLNFDTIIDQYRSKLK